MLLLPMMRPLVAWRIPFSRIPFAYHSHAIPWFGYRAHTHTCTQDLQPDGFATRELALANYG